MDETNKNKTMGEIYRGKKYLVSPENILKGKNKRERRKSTE